MITKEQGVSFVLESEELEKIQELGNKVEDIKLRDLYRQLYVSSLELSEIFRGLTKEQKDIFSEQINLSLGLKTNEDEIEITEPEYLTTNDVSKLLGISPQSVRKWCELKKIDAFRTFGHYGEWKISIDQFKQNKEMERKYWELIKQKRINQNKTHKALKKIDLETLPDYKEFIKEIE